MLIPAIFELDWNGWPNINWPHFWFGFLQTWVESKPCQRQVESEIIVKIFIFWTLSNDACNLYLQNMNLHAKKLTLLSNTITYLTNVLLLLIHFFSLFWCPFFVSYFLFMPAIYLYCCLVEWVCWSFNS